MVIYDNIWKKFYKTDDIRLTKCKTRELLNTQLKVIILKTRILLINFVLIMEKCKIERKLRGKRELKNAKIAGHKYYSTKTLILIQNNWAVIWF